MPNQVFGSNNWANTVNTINEDPVVIEVTAVNEPLIVEVQTQGPSGPAGPAGPAGQSAPVKTVRIDSSVTGTIYTGKAAQGSLESSSVWTIYKSTFNSAGVRTSVGSAVNVSWTGRTGHTYI